MTDNRRRKNEINQCQSQILLPKSIAPHTDTDTSGHFHRIASNPSCPLIQFSAPHRTTRHCIVVYSFLFTSLCFVLPWLWSIVTFFLVLCRIAHLLCIRQSLNCVHARNVREHPTRPLALPMSLISFVCHSFFYCHLRPYHLRSKCAMPFLSSRGTSTPFCSRRFPARFVLLDFVHDHITSISHSHPTYTLFIRSSYYGALISYQWLFITFLLIELYIKQVSSVAHSMN